MRPTDRRRVLLNLLGYFEARLEDPHLPDGKRIILEQEADALEDVLREVGQFDEEVLARFTDRARARLSRQAEERRGTVRMRIRPKAAAGAT